MTNEPTDEALENLFVEETGFDPDDFPAAIFGFTRAALTKWGTPQPSPVGPPAPRAEPVAWLNPWRADQVTTDYDAYGRRGIPLYTAPQPTQTQAVAVTDAQVLAAVRVVSPGLFRHGLQPLPNDGANTAAQMRKEADTVRKMLEAANGIKGGQHVE